MTDNENLSGVNATPQQIQPQQRAVAAPPKTPLVGGGKLNPIYPQTIDEAVRYAQMILASGVYPDSIKKKLNKDEQVSTVVGTIFKGMEVGLPPMAALSGIMEVNGRYCVWGDAALALAFQSGLLDANVEKFEGEFGKDDFVAVCILTRKGNPVPIERRFTWADAKAAKLTGKTGPWLTYPKRMLQMRARSWALRDGFSDVLQGLGIVEEVNDIPTDKSKEPVKTDFLDAGPAAPQLTNQTPTPIEEVEAARERAKEQGIHVAYAERPVEEKTPIDKALDAVAQADGDVLPMGKYPKTEAPVPQDCKTCEGHGVSPVNPDAPCPDCDGQGIIQQ